jgi:hypothetical protein
MLRLAKVISRTFRKMIFATLLNPPILFALDLIEVRQDDTNKIINLYT